MKKGQAKRFYVFGVFRIDVGERVLLSEKGPVSLTPKAFDLLLFLVENSGHILDKEELMKQVWPDSFVEENNLADNISTLRKVLGDDAKEPKRYVCPPSFKPISCALRTLSQLFQKNLRRR